MNKLDGVVAVACADGNWNYNEYSRGFANGLILARSILIGEEPEFMDSPDEWLKDRPGPIPDEVPCL